jgi:hypothetical protein
MYTFLKYFASQIYSCSFHMSKLNDFKIIHNLYFQCLTQTLSKMIHLPNRSEYEDFHGVTWLTTREFSGAHRTRAHRSWPLALPRCASALLCHET